MLRGIGFGRLAVQVAWFYAQRIPTPKFMTSRFRLHVLYTTCTVHLSVLNYSNCLPVICFLMPRQWRRWAMTQSRNGFLQKGRPRRSKGPGPLVVAALTPLSAMILTLSPSL